MSYLPPTDSHPPTLPRGVVTNAETHAHSDTAQPSLTSGFGAVIAKERELLADTLGLLEHGGGGRSDDLDRLLQHQQSCLGANIALLEQRYEALPVPQRFGHWHGGSRPAPATPATDPSEGECLPKLIAQHGELLTNIRALVACDADGQRGELILREVGRHHEEMVRAINALLASHPVAAPASANAPAERPGITESAQQRWDNDGGAPRGAPVA